MAWHKYPSDRPPLKRGVYLVHISTDNGYYKGVWNRDTQGQWRFINIKAGNWVVDPEVEGWTDLELFPSTRTQENVLK